MPRKERKKRNFPFFLEEKCAIGRETGAPQRRFLQNIPPSRRNDLPIQDGHFVVEAAVHVVVSEVPMPIRRDNFQIRKHMVLGILPPLKAAGAQGRVHERPRPAGMGDDIIDLVAVPLQVGDALVRFLVGGQLFLPPGYARAAMPCRRYTLLYKGR